MVRVGPVNAVQAHIAGALLCRLVLGAEVTAPATDGHSLYCGATDLARLSTASMNEKMLLVMSTAAVQVHKLLRRGATKVDATFQRWSDLVVDSCYFFIAERPNVALRVYTGRKQ